MNVQLPDVLAALQASLSRTGFDDWYQLSLDKEELRDQHDALVNGLKNERALRPFQALVDSCVAQFSSIVQTAQSVSQQNLKTRRALAKACKALQLKRGEVRRPDDPDPVVTGAVATITTTIEACMTFLVLFGGGASLSEAIGFGLLFAGIGTALAHILGFHGLRRISYRFLPELDAQSKLPKARRRRGRIIVTACLSLIGLLVFSAARLRATGDLEKTFDFSEVGFLATFDDGMAIALVAMAFVTTCLNTWQGLTGWSDRAYGFEVPFNELAHHEDGVLDQIDDFHGKVEETADKAIDSLYERRTLLQDYVEDPSETVEQNKKDVRKHNVEVRAALKDELRFQRIQNSVRDIEDSPTLATTEIESTFAALFIPESEMASDDDAVDQAHASIALIDDLIARLEAAKADTHAKIDLVGSEFSADDAVLGSEVLQ